MSRVYFTSRELEAELRGSERAWLGLLVDHIGSAVLQSIVPRDDLLAMFPPDHYVRNGLSRHDDLRVALNIMGPELTIPDGRRVPPWVINLNTVTLLGHDALSLGGIIHAQCEIHGWFPHGERDWVVPIIDAALRDHIYRPDQGWDQVRELFVKDPDGPIVMASSVTDSFPGRGLVIDAGLGPDKHLDAEYWWESLTDDQRWDLGVKALDTGAPRITGETFGDGFEPNDINAFSLAAMVNRAVP